MVVITQFLQGEREGEKGGSSRRGQKTFNLQKLSRGEICVANFLPPANGERVWVDMWKQKHKTVLIYIIANTLIPIPGQSVEFFIFNNYFYLLVVWIWQIYVFSYYWKYGTLSIYSLIIQIMDLWQKDETDRKIKSNNA